MDGERGPREPQRATGRRLRLYEKIYSTFNERAHRLWQRGWGRIMEGVRVGVGERQKEESRGCSSGEGVVVRGPKWKGEGINRN